MADKTLTTTMVTIDILGKPYSIKCPESEVTSLQESAVYLNERMVEMQTSSKMIGSEKIAIITALNVAHQFLLLEQQKKGFVHNINQRIAHLEEKLDNTIKKSLQPELIYTAE